MGTATRLIGLDHSPTRIGVAMASPDHADMQAWLHSADEALYRSKRQGRGRISFDGAVPGAA